MLTLYLAPGASSMAPHIMLHEVGAPFETRLISLKQKQQRSPEFLAVNPEGKVPVLVLAGGHQLTEVAAILYYLARSHPAANLWPEQIGAQADVLSWMSFAAATLHPARALGLEGATPSYQIADRRLGKQDWITGDYSIADIHLFRLYWRLKNSLHPGPELFPALDRHYERMMQRDAVKRTIAAERAMGYELPG